MSTILTKTAKTGQQVAVALDNSEVKQLVVTLDGRRVCSGWLQALQQPKGDVTHHIGGKVGFTATEASIIESAFRAACAPTLHEQRTSLVHALRGAEEDQDVAYERGHQSDGSAAMAAAKSWQSKVDAARAALAAFDAAHPEVLAAINSEKAERAERTL